MRVVFLFYNDHDNDIASHYDGAKEKWKNDFTQSYQMMHLCQIVSECYSAPTLIYTIKYYMKNIFDEIKNDNNNASKFVKIKNKKEAWAIILKHLEKEENKNI